MKMFKYRDKSGKREYRWHLKARNGEIICHSEGYTDKRDRDHTLNLVCNLILTAVDVIDKDEDSEYPS